MRFELDDDAVALRSAIERQVSDCAAGPGDAAQRASRLWGGLVEAGWSGLALPEDQGGVDADAATLAFLMECMGYHGLVTPFLSGILLGARLLARARPGEAGTAIVAAVAAGEAQLHFAYFDFDPRQGAQARAVDGGWHLTGRKYGVLGITDAGNLLVWAHVDQDPALFLVPAKASGVAVRSLPGLRGEPVGEVALDCQLGADSMVASGAVAQELVDEAIDCAVIALCAEAFGAIRRLCEMTVEHVKLRKQFQKSLSSFQVIQHRIAEMAVQREDAQSALLLATASARREDARARTVATAKVIISDAARYVAQQAVQLHGAMGVTEELAVGRYFRLLTAFDAVLGGRDYHHDRYDRLVVTENHQQYSVILGND